MGYLITAHTDIVQRGTHTGCGENRQQIQVAGYDRLGQYLSRFVEKVQSKLQSKYIAIQNAGSIAEASLQLNGVFESVQAAAEQYLENIKRMSDQQEQMAQQLQADAQKQADAMIAEADAYRAKAYKDADDYWQQVSDKAQALLRDQESLRQLILGGRNST